MHHGFSPEEIVRAFDRSAAPANDAALVSNASRIIGECIARDRVVAWARPFGGGTPVRLPADAWELDDFRRRFATAALDPRRPFDAQAEATHWIFLDADGFDALIEASLPDARPPRRATGAAAPEPIAIEDAERWHEARDRAESLLRLPEVKRRTGLSRSTIYRRIGEGRFPASVELGGDAVAWRESKVAEWIANPR